MRWFKFFTAKIDLPIYNLQPYWILCFDKFWIFETFLLIKQNFLEKPNPQFKSIK